MDSQVRLMVNFFVRKKSNNEDEQTHNDLVENIIDEWKELNNQEGRYAPCYAGPPPARKAGKELQEDQKKLTLENVKDWVVKTNYHPAHLPFFSTLELTAFVKQTVTSLLSITRSVGSISVERVAKPLKNKVLTKARNQLEDEKAELLLRVGLNLTFLAKANKAARPVTKN